jgi:hypothetical protein
VTMASMQEMSTGIKRKAEDQGPQLGPPPQPMSAAAAVADSKNPPGDDYEEIREQVRHHRVSGFARLVILSWVALGCIPSIDVTLHCLENEMRLLQKGSARGVVELRP